jgi:hypothetical protein
MSKIDEAKSILELIGMPKEQQAEVCALTLLALCAVQPDTSWNDATNEWIRIHDAISFFKTAYGKTYAENSRETIRKQALHHFRNAAVVEDNGMATNSPAYRYRVTEEALQLIQTFGATRWDLALADFLKKHQRLVDKYSSKKKMEMMPVMIDSHNLLFSPGEHNTLQKNILEQFAPRFAPASKCLYVGDTIKKDLIKDDEYLSKLGFEVSVHDKMPDVILYRKDKDWLFFIEAVTSVGPITSARMEEINKMTKNVKSGKVFVTAFPDFDTYKSFSSDLAWETEVWIADRPDHMIHLNGNKFLGPR